MFSEALRSHAKCFVDHQFAGVPLGYWILFSFRKQLLCDNTTTDTFISIIITNQTQKKLVTKICRCLFSASLANCN